MSRRAPNPSAERAAQNQQTLKTLVKIESNKSCADCKRNKHPRWASWNLGIFVCIRCSGIHRGMGTHISRVKSVDLDAWTDEQLQNMLRWGNARANKYWEAKLAPGHVPAENKIENFIRTKYDSRRWVMDGEMPDPSTLDDATTDDEVPLNIVQEKVKLERSASTRTSSAPTHPPKANSSNPDIDLFANNNTPMSKPLEVTRMATMSSNPPVPSKAIPAGPRPTKPGDSLLGFDFFGNTPSNIPARPSSAAASVSNSTGPSRPDLKQSILSLYSSGPRASSNPATQSRATQQISYSNQQSLASLGDDFKNLNFSSGSSTQTPIASSRAPSSVPNAISAGSNAASAPVVRAASLVSGGGGSFFDTKPSQTAQTPAPNELPQSQATKLSTGRLSDIEAKSAVGVAFKNTNNPFNKPIDMLDLSPNPASTISTNSAQKALHTVVSPFNLSSTKGSTTTPAAQTYHGSSPKGGSGLAGIDPWGSNEAWASSTPAAATSRNNPVPSINSTVPSTPRGPANIPSPADEWGWNSNTGAASPVNPGGLSKSPAQQHLNNSSNDDEFGGWENNGFVTTAPQTQPKSTASSARMGTYASNDNDLFSNVWE